MQFVCETCLSSDRQLVATSRIMSILREIRLEELANKVICWECHAIISKFHTFKLQVKKVQIELTEKNKFFSALSKLLLSTKLNYDFEFIHNYELFTNEINEEIKESNIKYENDYDTTEDLLTFCNSNHEENEQKCTLHIDTDDKVKVMPKKKIFLENNKSQRIQEKVLKEEEIDEKQDFSVLKVESKAHQRNTISKKKPEESQKRISTNKISFSNDQKPIKKKSLSSKKKEIDALKEKFETVHLSDEELIRSREEKRNHPNYKKIPFKCDMCVLGFTKKENYDMHFTKKHNECIGPHVCSVCSVRFASGAAAGRHRALHFTRYACSLCAYSTASLSAAATHCRDKHALDERDKIHCKQCPAVFSSSEDLSQHTRSEHVLFCKDCGEKFKGKHTLRAHRVRIHTVKREFTCEVCKRTFLSKSRLESHVVKHSQTLAQRLAYCAVCKVQYKNIQVYRSHIQNSANHAQNRYQCPECSKKFASKIYRTKHYNFYHLNKSQYKCHSCNKLFISQWRLKNHRQKHHGLARTRNHECSHCGKKFYTSSCLAVHCSTHAARRHLCARCGAIYRHPAALYAHERRAHSTQIHQ